MKRSQLIIIIILCLALITSLILIARLFLRRSQNRILENSYLFVSPLQAKADGKEKIRLTVFLLDGKGLGISNQKIDLDFPSQLTVANIQPITNNSGQAVFDLSSKTAGNFNISATTKSGTIPQPIKAVFY